MTGKCTLKGNNDQFTVIDVLGRLSSSLDGAGGVVFVELGRPDLPEQILFRAFNANCEATYAMTAQNIEGQCNAGLSCASLGNILRSSKAGGHLEIYENGVIVKSKNGIYKLPSCNVEPSPFADVAWGESLCEPFSPDMLSGLAQIIGKGETKKGLEFAKIFSTNGDVKAWACNDRNFVQMFLGRSRRQFSFTVHRAILNLLAGFGQGEFYGGNGSVISYKGADFSVRFSQGAMPYPDLNKIAPMAKETTACISFDSKEMADALEAAVLIAKKEGDRFVHMSFKSGHLSMQCLSDSAESRLQVNTAKSVKGGDWEINFGVSVLGTALRLFPGNLYLGVKDDKSMAFISRLPLDSGVMPEFIGLMPIVR